jgi:hypothetical protein
MPYTVTTRRPPEAPPNAWLDSCRTVDTLDDLDRDIRREYAVSLELPESGTVTLPDGTILGIARERGSF